MCPWFLSELVETSTFSHQNEIYKQSMQERRKCNLGYIYRSLVTNIVVFGSEASPSSKHNIPKLGCIKIGSTLLQHGGGSPNHGVKSWTH